MRLYRQRPFLGLSYDRADPESRLTTSTFTYVHIPTCHCVGVTTTPGQPNDYPTPNIIRPKPPNLAGYFSLFSFPYLSSLHHIASPINYAGCSRASILEPPPRCWPAYPHHCTEVGRPTFSPSLTLRPTQHDQPLQVERCRPIHQ